MTDVLARPTPRTDRSAPLGAGAPDVLVVEHESPIDRYLREQQTMTAVERFSRHHDDLGGAEPEQARYYRDLIPLERPKAGQQYAFEVDLDACSGCKACVTACHRLNGLDDGESFRSAGSLVGTVATDPSSGSLLETLAATVGTSWQQTVTTACHHCVDPACLNGCPVDAYEKDPVTGIVRHLDDQCIGCSYCTLTCPYEVPRFNADLGIVRKCDLCSDRLAEGEAPACVQACPTSAIRVGIVEVAEAITRAAAEGTLVPAAPSSAITVPTTRYRSSRPLPTDALPADHFSLVPSHPHPPLTVMLVLTQLSVGAFVLAWLVDLMAAPALADRVRPFEAGVALGVGVLAMAASLAHLGRPHLAWRAVIGLGHSWLSREIVAFGAFAGMAAAYAAAVLVGVGDGARIAVGGAAAVAGLAGVACSAMIYASTRRTWWRLRRTGPLFAGTAIITGGAAVIATALVASAGDHAAYASALTELVRPVALLVAAASAAKLLGEAALFRHLRDDRFTDLRRTAMLARDHLGRVTSLRFAAGAIGGVVVPLVLVAVAGGPIDGVSVAAIVAAVLGLVAVVAAELCERWLFFRAATAPRMPGVPS